jgi:hypothetical protein
MDTGGFFAIFGLLAIAGLAFWIWALVDSIRVPDDSLYRSGTKLVWVLVIVLAGWIGAIIYLAVGRPEGGASAAITRWEGAGRQRPAPPQPGSIPPPPVSG